MVKDNNADFILNKYFPKGVKRDISKHLREAFFDATSFNGIYPDLDDRDRVWKYFNEVADKILNKKI